MEDEHKERMSTLKSTLKDLKKEYEEVAKSVTSADTVESWKALHG